MCLNWKASFPSSFDNNENTWDFFFLFQKLSNGIDMLYKHVDSDFSLAL